MDKIVKTFDEQSLLVKIILALPIIDIAWSIYRLCKSLAKKNTLGIVLAIVLLVLGPAIFWLIDIISLLLIGKVIWFD